MARHRPWPSRAYARSGTFPNCAPALGGLRVELGGGAVAGDFVELGLHRGERVLVERRDGSDAGAQPLGERRVVQGERATHHGGQAGDEVGSAGAELVELPQQRVGVLALTLGKQKLGDGGENERNEVR